MTAPLPRQPVSWSALANPWVLLGTGLGSGLAPWAPGTAGTVVIMILAFWQPWLASPLPVVLLAVLGPWICGRASRQLGRGDHPAIVWDEWSGMLLALAFIPFEPMHWLAAFVLFRLFDIVKPWPIRLLDRQMGGGLGIMADDWLAGLFAAAVFHGVVMWF
jgi:phosphatidylglycerophosphatase A